MVRGTRSLKRAIWGSSSSQGTMEATACRAVRRTSAELSFRLARNTCCSTGNDSCRCSPACRPCSPSSILCNTDAQCQQLMSQLDTVPTRKGGRREDERGGGKDSEGGWGREDWGRKDSK